MDIQPQTNPLIDEFDRLSPGLKAALAQTGQTMAGQAGAGGAAAPQGGALTMPHAAPALPAGAESPKPAAATPSLFSTPTPKVGTGAPSLFGGNTEAGPATIAPPAKKMPALPDLNPRIQEDEDELTRKVKTGSGISQISGKIQGLMPNHRILGKILGGAAQGLATLGDVGLGAVEPAIELGLPGTQGHHNLLIKRDESLLGHDYANQKTAADTAHTNAQTGLAGAQTDETNTRTGLLPQEASDKHDVDQAQIANLNSQVEERKNALPKSPLELALKNNPNLTAQEWLNMEQHPISKEQAAALNGTWDLISQKSGLPTGQFKEGMSQAEATALSSSLNNSIGKSQGAQRITIQTGAADRKAANDPAVEREYQALHKDWSGQFGTATDQLTTLRQARSMIDSGAVGQALGQVKTLVGLAGGKGTGVRITQAELNALPAARGLAGGFEGYFNKLEGQGSLTKDQVHQVDELLSQAAALIQNKQAMYNDGLNRLGTAQTKEELRKIDSDMRQQLMGGGGEQTQGGAQATPPPGADVKVRGADGNWYWGNSKTKQAFGRVN